MKDLWFVVEIKMDYYMDSDYIVSAQEIEIGLKNLMKRKVMMDGGSSHSSLGHFMGHFLEDMMNNIPCKKQSEI